MRQPVNPVFPFFTARCAVCGGEANSMSAVCGEKPFTFVCFIHQTDEEREAVRLHANEQVRRFRVEQPGWVAHARRSLGLARPLSADPRDPSWDGCRAEARRFA